jgi:transcriptional regulator of heat shock response
MEEIENVYKIIHDETYNNQVLLDIELSKISDQKLVVGMLCDLYAKEGYKADKDAMILSMRNYCDIEDLDLQECNAYFIDKMKEYRSTKVKAPSADKLKQFLSILQLSMKQAVDGHVTLPENKEYVDFVKELSNDEFEFFKNILIGQELYEEVTNMINIRL